MSKPQIPMACADRGHHPPWPTVADAVLKAGCQAQQ
jgi:hypothetical protein